MIYKNARIKSFGEPLKNIIEFLQQIYSTEAPEDPE